MLLDTYLSAHYKLWIALKSHEYKMTGRYIVYSLSRCHPKTTYVYTSLLSLPKT